MSEGEIDRPTREVSLGEHKDVGAYPAYGHDRLTIMGELRVCLDCGYVHDDVRDFYHVDCEREKNPINETWREHGFDGDDE